MGCGGRGGAIDEQRLSGRRSRVVLTPRRWCQVGGGNSTDDGGKRARSPGRARYKPLKPLRAGMPGCSGGPVVTNARVYYTTRAAAGASAPGIPHALMGGKFSTTRAHRAAGSRSRILAWLFEKLNPLNHPCTTDFAIMQWIPLEPFTVCVTRKSAARLQSV